ncbi:neuroendocrine convertase 2-like [Tubulanus polymorphus]|uniref:neuroendocrine convertase 2-like n=1 Tax=Tubulanus polymorphus TaxID=672921 RepID=UPI003DA49CD0
MMGRRMILICLSFLLVIDCSKANHLKERLDYTNDFAVELQERGDDMVADLVAGTHGFKVVRRMSAFLDNVYHFQHNAVNKRSRRSAEDFISLLNEDPHVTFVEQQVSLDRVKRSTAIEPEKEDDAYKKAQSVLDKLRAVKNRLEELAESKPQPVDTKPKSAVKLKPVDLNFNDPQFKNQMYLVNKRMKRSLTGTHDLNIAPIWKQGITGKGVVVTVIDDGLDHRNTDLKTNYDPKASDDLNSPDINDHDPIPNSSVPGNDHGTMCGGEIAATANNSFCGVGIAYNANIGGVRMLDGRVTDLLEAEALLFQSHYIDIKTASWGPRDDGMKMEGPRRYVHLALNEIATKGRNGLGTLVVFASGNGGGNGDCCNADGYVSNTNVINIGAVDGEGKLPSFGEHCASVLTSVYTKSPGGDKRTGVVTTDWFNGCSNHFSGTSSAAPIAAGCFALALEANPKLTRRDVQNLVVRSSRIPYVGAKSWLVNGAGYHFSHDFGFGVLDCGRLVELAQKWKTVPELHICKTPQNEENKHLKSKGSVISTITTDGCETNKSVNVGKLEHVEVKIDLDHTRRGDVQLQLTSPTGTTSTILFTRYRDNNDMGIHFTFMSVHFWGETAKGTWTLNVTDIPASGNSENVGTLKNWSLILYGVAENPENTDQAKTMKRGEPRENLKAVDLLYLMVREARLSRSVKIQAVDEDSVDVEKEKRFNEISASYDRLMGLSSRKFQELLTEARAKSRNTATNIESVVDNVVKSKDNSNRKQVGSSSEDELKDKEHFLGSLLSGSKENPAVINKETAQQLLDLIASPETIEKAKTRFKELRYTNDDLVRAIRHLFDLIHEVLRAKGEI